MSRVSKWKLEKAKVKVVFRLQFHATHVPQAGWDKLFISFIPSDSAKVTAKTTKANVRNGTCKWADPIYETTRLLLDSRSKIYDEKLYKFVVAMGSSRSGILGEATINLADYTDALKPSIVSLPLQGCSSGTILHVTVQLLTSKTGFREFEQQRELRDRGLHTGIDVNSRDGADRVSSSENMANDQTEKVSARIGLRPEFTELPSLEEETGLHEEFAVSPVGIDVSSNTSGSLYAEKHDNSSTHEIDSLNYSADNDLAIANEENNRLKGSLELAESTILELKHEVASLRNHADEIGIETQKFAQQISAEISSSEELAEEISVMKLECSKLKNDLQKVISLKSSPQFDKLYQGVQLRWRKGLLVAEEKIREIQRKVYLSLDDREARLVHVDFEALLSLLLELKQENLPSEIAIGTRKSEQYLPGNDLDMDLFHPPDMLHCLNIPNVSHQDHDSVIATKAMEDKIFELLRELDASKVEREEMIRKMNEMECYYEALVLDLEENQKQMLVELQNLRNENSTCLYTVATTNAEIESLRREASDQVLRFSHERHESDLICKELERRAITSEAALKRARLNYSIAVDQLQKDLDLLSFQVLSMYETNENLIRKTCTEGFQFQSKQQVMGGDVLLDNMKKSLLFQEGIYHKVEEELSEMHVDSVHLDIFSKILQESLLQASSDIILMEKKIDELVQQLDLSTESRRLLTFQLQSTISDTSHQNHILELKAEGLANENFLLSEKIAQLEALLRDCSKYKTEYEVCSVEKGELANLLTQETVTKANLQKEMTSLYEELDLVRGEKSDLAQGNENLQTLVNSLEEKLGNLLKSTNEKHGAIFSTMNAVSRDIESVDLISVVSELEEFQLNVCGKTHQLLEEKKILEDERDQAQVLLSNATSETAVVRQKLENELQNVGAKLVASNALVEKLQLEIETLSNKLQLSLKVEGQYAKQNEELLVKIADLEGDFGRSKMTIDDLTREMQELAKSLKNKDVDNSKLESELNSLKEDFRFLHDELDLERSSKDNLQGTIDHLMLQLNEKNEQLLQFGQQEAELLHVRTRASDLELQKKSLEDERDQAHLFSSTAKSEVVNAGAKLEASNALVVNLQKELEAVGNKLQISLKARENYANHNRELLANLADLEGNLQNLASKNMDLVKEIEDMKTVMDELGKSKSTIDQLVRERQELIMSQENKDADNAKLAAELDSLKEDFRNLHDELDLERSSKNNLQATIDNLTSQLNEKNEQLFQFAHQEAELLHVRKWASELELKKKNLEEEREQAHALSSSASSEVLKAKKKFKHDIEYMSTKLEASNALLEKFQSELENLASKLHLSLETEEKYGNQDKELLGEFSLLDDRLRDLTSKNMELAEEISSLNIVSEELGMCKLTIADLTKEKEDLKQNMEFLHQELDTERSSKDNVQDTIDRLTAQLNENSKELLRFAEVEAELVHFKQWASDLERDKKNIEDERYQARASDLQKMGAKLEASYTLVEKLELELESLAKKLETSSEAEEKYAKQNQDLLASLSLLEGDLQHLTSKNADLAADLSSLNTVSEELESCKLALAELTQEKQILETSLQDKAAEIIKLEDALESSKEDSRSLHDELHMEKSLKDNQLLRFSQQEAELAHFRQLSSDLECEISELQEYIISSDIKLIFMRSQYEMGIEELALNFDLSDKQLRELEMKMTGKPATLSELEIGCLMSSDLERDILIIFLKAKFTENSDELEKLQRKCDELNNKLSEQVLKTEEFKNLSTHLKEIKDKAEAQSPSSAERESLRVAFIKEQYESRVQELRHQVSVSKKHADDMLLKFQDAVDELESAKRSEGANLRKNEELSLKILELESELQSIVSEKREKIKAYDLIKGELECALLSLEYCKEEKQRLEASLQGCIEKSHSNGLKERAASSPKFTNEHNLINVERTQEDGERSTAQANVQYSEGVPVPENGDNFLKHEHSSLEEDASLNNSQEHFAVIDHRAKIQSLKSSMDHLQQELERMKNENSLSPDEHQHADASILDLQMELLQLNEANEELRTRFPMFNELPGNGNALERVFALEVELAEALQAKKKSAVHFQSSFLKQHGDEQAMFQSFRDINELIKEMLELKGKHSSMERELKDMHDRYSQLSVQLAEVEGERQKLIITLKNSRSPNKLTLSNRSMSATLE